MRVRHDHFRSSLDQYACAEMLHHLRTVCTEVLRNLCQLLLRADLRNVWTFVQQNNNHQKGWINDSCYLFHLLKYSLYSYFRKIELPEKGNELTSILIYYCFPFENLYNEIAFHILLCCFIINEWTSRLPFISLFVVEHKFNVQRDMDLPCKEIQAFTM